MAVARFQVVRVARLVPLPAPREPGPAAGVAPLPQVTGFAWRFMSANNRCLARSARVFPDVEACLAAIRIVQEGLPHAVGETLRNENGQWMWRVRLTGEVVATAARTYQRQVRARLLCDLFLELVTHLPGSAPVQVVYR